MISTLPLEFYQRRTELVARDLIGMYLVCETGGLKTIGRIVETEAYREDDPASHSYRGVTERTRPMFRAGGVAYIYFIYGMYDCFNVVTEPEGVGCAVLIRAIEVVHGHEVMWERRFPGKAYNKTKMHILANGPGKLCRAMGITRKENNLSLVDSRIRLAVDSCTKPFEIGVGPRIGIRHGEELPWRFFALGHPSVGR